jgi:hypothetical protein
VQPRSTNYRRCLHLIRVGDCLLRLFSKPYGDRVPLDLGTTTNQRQCPTASSGGRRIQFLELGRCSRS